MTLGSARLHGGVGGGGSLASSEDQHLTVGPKGGSAAGSMAVCLVTLCVLPAVED